MYNLTVNFIKNAKKLFNKKGISTQELFIEFTKLREKYGFTGNAEFKSASTPDEGEDFVGCKYRIIIAHRRFKKCEIEIRSGGGQFSIGLSNTEVRIETYVMPSQELNNFVATAVQNKGFYFKKCGTCGHAERAYVFNMKTEQPDIKTEYMYCYERMSEAVLVNENDCCGSWK